MFVASVSGSGRSAENARSHPAFDILRSLAAVRTVRSRAFDIRVRNSLNFASLDGIFLKSSAAHCDSTFKKLALGKSKIELLKFEKVQAIIGGEPLPQPAERPPAPLRSHQP